MKIFFKTKCPYCNTSNCYNSGLSIECINVHCQFYSINHAKMIESFIAIEFANSKKEPSSFSNNEKENSNQSDSDNYPDYLNNGLYPWHNGSYNHD